MRVTGLTEADYDEKFIKLKKDFYNLKKKSLKKIQKIAFISRWKIWLIQDDREISIVEFCENRATIERANWAGHESITPANENTDESYATIPVVLEKSEINDSETINKLNMAVNKICGIIPKDKKDRWLSSAGHLYNTKNEFILEIYSDDENPTIFFKKFKRQVTDIWSKLLDIQMLYTYDFKNKVISWKNKNKTKQ